MSILYGLTILFGLFVWSLIALLSLAVTVFAAVHLWEAACLTGYRAFARRAEKDAIRQRAAIRAETAE